MWRYVARNGSAEVRAFVSTGRFSSSSSSSSMRAGLGLGLGLGLWSLLGSLQPSHSPCPLPRPEACFFRWSGRSSPHA